MAVRLGGVVRVDPGRTGTGRSTRGSTTFGPGTHLPHPKSEKIPRSGTRTPRSTARRILAKQGNGRVRGTPPPRPHRVGFAAERPVPVDRPSLEPRATVEPLPASREQTNTPVLAGAPRAATWRRRAAAFLDQVAIWTITFVPLATAIAVYRENSDVPLIFLFGGLLLATVVIAVSPAVDPVTWVKPSGRSYLGSGQCWGRGTF